MICSTCFSLASMPSPYFTVQVVIPDKLIVQYTDVVCLEHFYFTNCF